MTKQLISVKRKRDSVAIHLDKSASFEEINMAVSHIAEFTITQWAKRQHVTVADVTEAYLTMLQTYMTNTHKDDYYDRQ
jgi:hypothetical protein|nr:MAG TPA: septum site-determining protein [Caudoviricetes sp.]